MQPPRWPFFPSSQNDQTIVKTANINTTRLKPAGILRSTAALVGDAEAADALLDAAVVLPPVGFTIEAVPEVAALEPLAAAISAELADDKVAAYADDEAVLKEATELSALADDASTGEPSKSRSAQAAETMI